VRVVLVCPFARGSRLGNRITALRWKKLIQSLGHRAAITTGPPRTGYDVLVALHARRSAGAVRWSHDRYPDRRIVLALTGTDLYRDIHRNEDARRALLLADRLVVLHGRAVPALPRALRRKARVIRQSADAVRRAPRKRSRTFDVALVAHMRPEKDPLRAALAARLLPASSRLRVVHAGLALTGALRRAARREMGINPRYVWLGEVPAARALRLIAQSDVLVLTSVMEGGANVLGEAIVAGTPAIATRIPACLAALGGGYPGLFRAGDTRALARLLHRAETDRRFLAELRRRTRARRALFTAACERAAWKRLLGELSVRRPGSARRARPPATRRSPRTAPPVRGAQHRGRRPRRARGR
jgi:putative glycosyltransferase (TIGR04348 family)